MPPKNPERIPPSGIYFDGNDNFESFGINSSNEHMMASLMLFQADKLLWQQLKQKEFQI